MALAWITPQVVGGALMALSALKIVPARSPGLALAVAAALLSALLPLALYARHPSPETLRTTFYVQALGVVILATAWFAAVAL